MISKLTVRDVDVRGKRVLVRVDFNVPLKQGTVTDDTRIKEALPTINYLLDNDAKIILMSHLGRPSGTGYEEEYSLKPAARVFEKLIGRPVKLYSGLVGDEVVQATLDLKNGEILLLENTRFDAREKKNDPELSREMARLGDIFVNDAFGSSHRAHCSIEGVANYLPSVAGMLLDTEVSTLKGMLSGCEHPFVAILGGSKVSDKIGVISSLIEKVDALLIGGGMCFTFLAAQGKGIGKSLFEKDFVESAKEMLAKADSLGVKLMLPVDVVCNREFAECESPHICSVDEIPDDMMGLDIGPDTVALYSREIECAKTIFWNGPMGVFEMPCYESGTRLVATAVADNSIGQSVIGGGDSVAAVKKFGLESKISFISTGGGASMKLVEGKPLPGVECLDNRK